MRKITNKSRFNRIHLEMIRAIVSFALVIADNIPITNSIPAWKAIIDRIKATLAELDNLIEQKSLSLKGYSQQKRVLKVSLVETTTWIMNAVYNYALSINDEVLAEKMLTSKSKVERMSYEDIVPFAQAAIDEVTPLIPSLANFDVTQQMVDDWQDNTTDLLNVLATVKNYYSNRRTINKNIQTKLRECMIALYKECDTFITSFKAGTPDYYNDYWANRKLKPLTEHTKFKVTVTDELNQPVFDVKIEQDGTDNMTATNIHGEATLQVKVHEGSGQQPVYSFTITSGTQAIPSGNIEIKLGTTVSRSYIVQPNGFIIPAPVEENTNVPS